VRSERFSYSIYFLTRYTWQSMILMVIDNFYISVLSHFKAKYCSYYSHPFGINTVRYRICLIIAYMYVCAYFIPTLLCYPTYQNSCVTYLNNSESCSKPKEIKSDSKYLLHEEYAVKLWVVRIV
jgi:uncharacterized membrane protein YesL